MRISPDHTLPSSDSILSQQFPNKEAFFLDFLVDGSDTLIHEAVSSANIPGLIDRACTDPKGFRNP